MRRIIFIFVAMLVAGFVFAGVINFDGTTQKFKRIIASVSLSAGDRIVIVKNPTKITGGTILSDSTIPASTKCDTIIKMVFTTK